MAYVGRVAKDEALNVTVLWMAWLDKTISSMQADSLKQSMRWAIRREWFLRGSLSRQIMVCMAVTKHHTSFKREPSTQQGRIHTALICWIQITLVQRRHQRRWKAARSTAVHNLILVGYHTHLRLEATAHYLSLLAILLQPLEVEDLQLKTLFIMDTDLMAQTQTSVSKTLTTLRLAVTTRTTSSMAISRKTRVQDLSCLSLRAEILTTRSFLLTISKLKWKPEVKMVKLWDCLSIKMTIISRTLIRWQTNFLLKFALVSSTLSRSASKPSLKSFARLAFTTREPLWKFWRVVRANSCQKISSLLMVALSVQAQLMRRTVQSTWQTQAYLITRIETKCKLCPRCLAMRVTLATSLPLL